MPSILPLEPLILRLADYFKKHKREDLLTKLRHYWVYEKRRPLEQWSPQDLLEWFARLRIPPFDQLYAIRDRGKPCPFCKENDSRYIQTAVIFPGGSVARCRRCQGKFLDGHAEPPPTTPVAVPDENVEDLDWPK